MANYLELPRDGRLNEVLQRFIREVTEDLNFENFGGEILDHTFTTTSNETVAHNLRRVPRHWVVLDTTVPGYVYRGAASTADDITLRSSAASGTIKILLI